MWIPPLICSYAFIVWRREESTGMLQRCSQVSLWHTGWWKGWTWEAQYDMEAAERGIPESGSSRLSTLMIVTTGNLVSDLPCMQQASYLEGSPLLWMLPLYLHVTRLSKIWWWLWWFYIALDKRRYPHNIFLISPQKVCCWYPLYVPCHGISNVYPNIFFLVVTNWLRGLQRSCSCFLPKNSGTQKPLYNTADCSTVSNMKSLKMDPKNVFCKQN